ncbi:Bifunctional purine biosynthetic protein ade1 [Diatrype stigma]|uniref:Phosphoribosylaminoimidazole-succinocarboxamide synthase n=1 Tax=Diatrype stigma TaxID=117547 RepID=A0AAN9YWW6_9PEZI
MSSEALTAIPLTSLPQLSKGKVRYGILAYRISAYDVILKNGISSKGLILTLLSAKWFEVLSSRIPGLKHHFLSLTPPPAPDVITPDERRMLRGRSMVVRRLKIFPIEAIGKTVISKGNLTSQWGSAWLCDGKRMVGPAGLKRCQQLPKPIYTPSTKAELGEKDLNISPHEAKAIVGEKYASRIEELALSCYQAGAAYAEERGIIIADTKFEFGLDEATDEIYLVDEVLTPDSSRFWSRADYENLQSDAIRTPKGKPDVEMPPEVVEKTKGRYMEVYELLTGKSLEEALKSLED